MYNDGCDSIFFTVVKVAEVVVVVKKKKKKMMMMMTTMKIMVTGGRPEKRYLHLTAAHEFLCGCMEYIGSTIQE